MGIAGGIVVGVLLMAAGGLFAAYGWPRRAVRQYRMAALNGIAVVVLGALVVLVAALRA